MNIQRFVLFLGVFLGGVLSRAFCEESALLSSVVRELSVTKNWKSSDAIAKLNQVIMRGSDRKHKLTAKVLVAQFIASNMSHATGDERRRLLSICNDLILNEPNTWQANMARYITVGEKGFSGDYEGQVFLAKKALEDIDFDEFAAEADPALLAIRRVYGDHPYFLREGLKLMLVNAFCELGKIDEAEKVHSTLTIEEHSDIMRERINLAKRASKNKSQPSHSNQRLR